MTRIGVIFASALGTAGAVLAFLMIRFNIKRVQIIRAASRATPEQLETIFCRVEECGTEPPVGFVLARVNEVIGDRTCKIVIPGEFKTFPWAGKTLAVDVEAQQKARFYFSPDKVTTTQLLGRKYRTVAVPRVVSNNGKRRNLFTPSRYMKLNKGLATALATICPRYPSELLAYLLSTGLATFEFDAINQARIGASPAWIQDPEIPTCAECGKRMTFILQLPGSLVDTKALHEATFYLFGCKHHPERTDSVTQYS